MASHAQKYFIRQDLAQDDDKMKNRRVSIHDISTLEQSLPPRNQRKRRKGDKPGTVDGKADGAGGEAGKAAAAGAAGADAPPVKPPAKRGRPPKSAYLSGERPYPVPKAAKLKAAAAAAAANAAANANANANANAAPAPAPVTTTPPSAAALGVTPPPPGSISALSSPAKPEDSTGHPGGAASPKEAMKEAIQTPPAAPSSIEH